MIQVTQSTLTLHRRGVREYRGQAAVWMTTLPATLTELWIALGDDEQMRVMLPLIHTLPHLHELREYPNGGSGGDGIRSFPRQVDSPSRRFPVTCGCFPVTSGCFPVTKCTADILVTSPSPIGRFPTTVDVSPQLWSIPRHVVDHSPPQKYCHRHTLMIDACYMYV